MTSVSRGRCYTRACPEQVLEEEVSDTPAAGSGRAHHQHLARRDLTKLQRVRDLQPSDTAEQLDASFVHLFRERR
jgi:hypothetical protein